MKTEVKRLGGEAISESRADSGRGTWRRWVPIVLVLVLGAGLRSAQYFGQVDMWHDELAVARNVEDRGPGELLTRPLDHLQVAPVGFLATLEATTAILGVTEAGLRLGPWLFGLASLLLFWRVGTRFAEGVGLLVPLALFAVSPALIWYGASVKPYGSDVTVSLLFVWLALRHLESPEDERRGLLAGGIGALALLFSFPAVPTAAILVLLLGTAWWRRRPRSSLRPLLALLLGWGAGIVAAGLVASGLVSDTTDAFMRDFHAGRFPPGELSGALVWAARSLYDVFAHSLVFFPPSNFVLGTIVALPLLAAVVGLARLLPRSGLRVAILLTPPVAGLLAAAFHLLPFGQRLGLHAAWPFLVLAGAGLHELTAMGMPGMALKSEVRDVVTGPDLGPSAGGTQHRRGKGLVLESTRLPAWDREAAEWGSREGRSEGSHRCVTVSSVSEAP